jgi:hypothetical protein
VDPIRKWTLIKAHNLSIFIQQAEGVDDDTWRFHLLRGDYSKWMSMALKDPELASEVEIVEKDESLALSETRTRIADAIKQKYTAPAT